MRSGCFRQTEAAQVAAHLKTCEECREGTEFVRPAVTAVAFSAEACTDTTAGGAVAPPRLKARVMKHVRAEAARLAKKHRYIPFSGPRTSPPRPAWQSHFSRASPTFRLSARNATQQQTIADPGVSPDSQHHPFAGGEVLTHGERLYLAMHGPAGRCRRGASIRRGRSPRARPPSRPRARSSPAPEAPRSVVRLPEAGADRRGRRRERRARRRLEAADDQAHRLGAPLGAAPARPPQSERPSWSVLSENHLLEEPRLGKRNP